jgi:cytochrome P450
MVQPLSIERCSSFVDSSSDLVTLTDTGAEQVLVLAPHLVQQVLVQREGLYINPPHPYKRVEGLLSASARLLVNIENNAQRTCTSVSLQRYLESFFDERTQELDEFARSNGNIRLVPWFKALMLDLSLRLLFNVRDSAALEEFIIDAEHVERLTCSADGLDSENLRRHSEAMERFVIETVAPGLPMPTRSPPSSGDVIHAVLRTLLNAYNALGVACAWMIYALATQPQISDTLRRAAFSSDRSSRLDLIAFLRETLRLYPPAWLLVRTALQRHYLGPQLVREGCLVIVCPYLSHRLERFWDRPALFNEQRFRIRRNVNLTPGLYFPFGGGTRVCPARASSLLILEATVRWLLGRYTFHAVCGEDARPEGLVSLWPPADLSVRLRLIQ